MFASSLGYSLGSYNAGAILTQSPGQSLVSESFSVQRWLFALSSQRGDKPAFRQLGLRLLRIAASCFPSNSILSVATPLEDFVGCPSEGERTIRDALICLESAGPNDAESLHLLGKMHEHGIGTIASISMAIQVFLFQTSVAYLCYICK